MDGSKAEIAIIGAGPIGIELAVGLKRAGIEYLHFDARQLGHTISWFAPQTRFFSSNERIAIAGVPLVTADQSKATREEYLAYLRMVVEQFDLQIRTYEPVVGIQKDGEGFVLKTKRWEKETQYRARKLVLATGGTERPRRLGVPGEELGHVSHYFNDPHRYFRKNLLIVGGANSAVEAALRSYHAGAHVAISYRGGGFDAGSIKYWLLPEINGLIGAGKIRGYFNSTVSEILRDRARLTINNGEEVDVAADFVLLLIGYEADMNLCRMAGVELEGAGQMPKFDAATMETNVAGVYVAGTAVGGTQERYRLFIENCHVHVERIVAALTGSAPPAAPMPVEQPES